MARRLASRSFATRVRRGLTRALSSFASARSRRNAARRRSRSAWFALSRSSGFSDAESAAAEDSGRGPFDDDSPGRAASAAEGFDSAPSDGPAPSDTGGPGTAERRGGSRPAGVASPATAASDDRRPSLTGEARRSSAGEGSAGWAGGVERLPGCWRLSMARPLRSSPPGSSPDSLSTLSMPGTPGEYRARHRNDRFRSVTRLVRRARTVVGLWSALLDSAPSVPVIFRCQ